MYGHDNKNFLLFLFNINKAVRNEDCNFLMITKHRNMNGVMLSLNLTSLCSFRFSNLSSSSLVSNSSDWVLYRVKRASSLNTCGRQKQNISAHFSNYCEENDKIWREVVRSRGRPQMTWIDSVKRALNERWMYVEQNKMIVQDRRNDVEWRSNDDPTRRFPCIWCDPWIRSGRERKGRSWIWSGMGKP